MKIQNINTTIPGTFSIPPYLARFLVTDELMPQRDRSYVYDDLGRLVTAFAPGSIDEISYEYDLVGNRTRRAFGPPEQQTVEVLSYDPETGLLASIEESIGGGAPESFETLNDEVGNLTAETRAIGQEYGYSPRNQLVAHNDLITFAYDAHGRRVRSSRATPSRTVHHYALPDGRPYLDKPQIQIGLPVPAWSFAYLGDRLLARYDDRGNIEHVIGDHIGFPLATYSYGGDELWQAEAFPFGDILDEQSSGPGHDPLIRYPGQWRLDPYLDTDEPDFTTLYYNYHRWYNPSWGRYTQSDPMSDFLLGGQIGLSSLPFSPSPLTPPGWPHAEPYVYAHNRPTGVIDPLGLYGTTECSYYDGRCQTFGCEYYCDWAPTMCRRFGLLDDHKWTRCTRKCLQEYDFWHCEPVCPGNPDCDEVESCNWKGHFFCYYECARHPDRRPPLPGMPPVYKG